MSQRFVRELSKKVGSEHSRIVPEIWKTVCTLEEAEILNVLRRPWRNWSSVSEPPEGHQPHDSDFVHKGWSLSDPGGKDTYRLPSISSSSMTPRRSGGGTPCSWNSAPIHGRGIPPSPAALVAMKIPPFSGLSHQRKNRNEKPGLAYEDAQDRRKRIRHRGYELPLPDDHAQVRQTDRCLPPDQQGRAICPQTGHRSPD